MSREVDRTRSREPAKGLPTDRNLPQAAGEQIAPHRQFRDIPTQMQPGQAFDELAQDFGELHTGKRRTDAIARTVTKYHMRQMLSRYI